MALPYYEKALKIDAGHPSYPDGVGNALVSLGRMEEAAEQMKGAISRRQDIGAAYNGLVSIRKFAEERAELQSILSESKTGQSIRKACGGFTTRRPRCSTIFGVTKKPWII